MNKSDKLSNGQLSRRNFLQGSGVVGAGLILSQVGLLHPTAVEAANHPGAEAEPEKVQDILDILATNEAFGVTLVGTVLDSAKSGTYSRPIPDKVQKALRGVRAQEQFHLDFLKRAGARLRTDTFYLADPNILTDPHTLFTDLVELEDAAIAAVMASFKTFARERRFDLLKQNFQFAAEESEHRLLANNALGVRPANNQAFAPAMFPTVAQFYEKLKHKGIIEGSGKKIVYPGPGEIDPSNVIYRTPGGPAVECTPK